jgi:3-methyladenine DNA glycosylase AlkD
METFIKYKRFEQEIKEENTQDFFDDLIKEGWQIIFYNEIIKIDYIEHAGGNIIPIRKFIIIVVAGKKQDNSLSKVL